MKKRIYFVTITCMMAMMFLCIGNVELSNAASDPVNIYDFEADENRLNASIACGNTTNTAIGYKLDGISEQSHMWSVDDGSICRINGSGKRISLTGLKEGLTRVRLSVTATDGNTYNDYTVISVYTPMGAVSGKTNKNTIVTRAAHSGTDNKNERGRVLSGTKMSIIGQCGQYYRATFAYTFSDGLVGSTGFVMKRDVTIPITAIALSKSYIDIKAGSADQLEANVMPSLTTENKKVTFTSSNKNVAVVYTDGVIYAKKNGTAVITAKVGSVSTKCTVNVRAAATAAKGASKKIKGKISKKLRYKFLNSGDAFGKKYKLNPILRTILAKKLVAAGYYSNVKQARREIDNSLKGKWQGSCYGMTVTTALNKKKQINVRTYTRSKGKAYAINRVATPKKNVKTADIINYYHASQNGYNMDEIYRASANKTAVKKLLKTAKKGYVQKFDFFMTEKNSNSTYAHSILLFNYSKKKSKKNWYAIESYDCSYATKNRCVYIHKKYNKIKVQGWSNTCNVDGFTAETDFGKYKKIKIK